MPPTVLKPGEPNKTNPYTVVIVANPWLESPRHSRVLKADPIMLSQPSFDLAANYIVDSLFGLLPGQKEPWFAAPPYQTGIRIVSLFPDQEAPELSNALVAEDADSEQLIARRAVIAPFLKKHDLEADVVYALSKSATHSRATAWYTTDHDGMLGVPFSLDGRSLQHRFYNRIPGTIAQHVTATGLTALHEFSHASSSYTNGGVTDLYVDSLPDLNNKQGRPIPANFATLDGVTYTTDPTRDGLGYPAAWSSFHPSLHDAANPALMDNYHYGSPPIACQHDTITRAFLLARILAKMQRPNSTGITH